MGLGSRDQISTVSGVVRELKEIIDSCCHLYLGDKMKAEAVSIAWTLSLVQDKILEN